MIRVAPKDSITVIHHDSAADRAAFWETYLVRLNGPLAVTFAGQERHPNRIKRRVEYLDLTTVCQACGQRRDWLHVCPMDTTRTEDL